MVDYGERCWQRPRPSRRKQAACSPHERSDAGRLREAAPVVAMLGFGFGFQTQARLRDPAAGIARVLLSVVSLLREEGAGDAGCTLHPRSRVRFALTRTAHEHTGEAEAVRHPLRGGFTAYFVLSPGTGLSCPRHLRDAKHHRKLDASVGAPGPHDFAVRDPASPEASPGLRPPEQQRRRSKRRSSDDTAASTASHPARSDDRDPPLLPG